MRGWAVAAVVGAALLVGRAQVAGQEATPASGLPAVPAPTECTVAPRPLAEVRALLATPVTEPTPGGGPFAVPGAEPPAPVDPESGGAPPVPIRFEPPTGPPADAATAAAVTATVRLFVACTNADDVLVLAALVTDDFVRQSFGGGRPGGSPDLAVASPAARASEDRVTLLAVREVRLLPDGRVGALVDRRDPLDPRRADVSTDFAFFVAQDGRYLIDRYVANVASTYAPLATPAP